jgi:hypothetical protein
MSLTRSCLPSSRVPSQSKHTISDIQHTDTPKYSTKAATSQLIRSIQAARFELHHRPENELRTQPNSNNVLALQHQYAALPSSTYAITNKVTDGGACVAMVGKDCVAIACDLRLGLQALTVSNNFPKIFSYGPSTFLGLTGLATDVSTVSELFRYKVNMYRLREERDISPKTFANLVSSSLYERRFGPWFVGPVVAGVEQKTGKPFICG